MIDNKKLGGFLSAALAFSLFVTGCSSENNKDSKDAQAAETSSVSDKASDEETAAETASAITSNVSTENLFSDRDLSSDYDSVTAEIALNGDSASIDGTGASCNGSDITITDEGVYRVSGTLNDGQILVDSVGKVQLVLDNANISCSDSAPIYIANADKTFITLAEGSQNSLSDGSAYVYDSADANEPDAAIFSADSLTFNGSGALDISANYNEGITSKDDIVITGGTINIVSAGNGIKGKDYVAVCGGNINIEAGGDGLKSSNTEDTSLGFVYAEGGTFNITAQEDGIQAETDFIASGGSFNVTSGGGSSAAVKTPSDDFGGMRGGFGGQMTQTEETAEDTVSTKGIKGSAAVNISGGTFNINAADDTLHSNGKITVSDGEFTLTSGNDGINADAEINISGGKINITESYEGIESAVINVSGGTIELKASDDGFNASDGTTSQGGMGTYSDGVLLNLVGGDIYVDADGDGLDSNGNFTVEGGNIIVNGPTNSGNGALDGNAGITVNGGLLIAAGSSGMAECPDTSSGQHSVSVTLDSTQAAGTLVTLCDGSGNEILSFAPSKTFNNVIISSPDIKDGETYTIYTGGTSSSEGEHGLSTGGYNGDGSEAGSFTADDMISFIGSQGMMNGGGFGGGGFGGGRGNGGGRGDFQMPTDENGEAVMPEGGFGGKHGDFQIPTDENGEAVMPDGEAMQIPTNANGEMEMPHGGFPGGGMGGMQEPPAGENGVPEMPAGGFDPNADSAA